MLQKKRAGGFTLIEILIVIAILAILSAFVASSLTTLQKTARDQKRKGDLNVLASVLQRFYNDNGHYPTNTPIGQIQYNSTDCSNTSVDKTVTWGKDSIICASNGVTKTYLKSAPADPIDNSSRKYCYHNTGNSYELGATLENTQDKEKQGLFFCATAGGGSSTYNYKVTPNK